MKTLMKGATLALLLSGTAAIANDSVIAETGKAGQWAIQTGDYANTRYSELDQINTSNVKDLRVAWTFSTGVLPEAIQPVGLRVTQDGSKVFVALGPANRVALIDGATDEVDSYILVGQRVWQLAFTPDEKFLYTTNGNSNDVTIIDVAAGEAVKSVQVGQQPWGVVVAPDPQ